MKKQAILAFSGKEPANVLHKNKPPRQESLFYPIAGIGASNGGLKALEQSCGRYRTRAAVRAEAVKYREWRRFQDCNLTCL